MKTRIEIAHVAVALSLLLVGWFGSGCVVFDIAKDRLVLIDSLAGFERIEIYRYKDAVADPKDFSREILYRKVETGAVVFEAATDQPSAPEIVEQDDEAPSEIDARIDAALEAIGSKKKAK